MGNSGLEDILNKAFGGMGKLLSEKKFPQNISAIRMLHVTGDTLQDFL
jgi:hypothetical protein